LRQASAKAEALVALTWNQESVILSDYVKKTWLAPSLSEQSDHIVAEATQPVPAFWNRESVILSDDLKYFSKCFESLQD